MIGLPWIKLAVYAVIAACLIGVGYGISDTISARKIAVLERDYANERTIAAEATRAAEADARRIEKGWRDHVSAREKEHALDVALRDDHIRRLDAAGNGLRNKLAAFTKTSSTPEIPEPPAAMFKTVLPPAGYYSEKLTTWRERAQSLLTTPATN